MEKKIGVYICKGCNIGDAVKIEKLEGIAKNQFRVPVCRTHDFLCSHEGLEVIKNDIDSEGINTIVISACSPRVKHEEFSFPNTIVERINMREFVAWSQEPNTDETQALAGDYMRMGIVKAQKGNPPEPYKLDETCKDILVIGGGISGLTSALGVAQAGYKVYLVERSPELGGWASRLYRQLPQRYPFDSIEEPTIKTVIEKVKSNPNIEVFTSSEIDKIAGFPGQFDVSIKTNGNMEQRKAGAVILAAGFRHYDANKLGYLGYGKSPNVITNVEMEEMAKKGGITRPSDGRPAKRVAFIQCAGSRDMNHLPYCSSYCCLTSLKQARYVREKDPDAMAYIIYKDMRTVGQYELFYKKMQDDPGVMLTKGEVTSVGEDGGNLYIDVKDTLLGGDIRLEADLVVLAVGMVPNTMVEPEELAKWKKIYDDKLAASGGKPDPNAPLEPHRVPNILKLQYRQGPELPVLEEAYGFTDSNYICFQYETRRTGIYAAGSIRQPMNMLECIQDAMGAGMKAIQCVEAIANGYAVHPRAWDQTFPEVNLQKCTSCKRCTEECPFGAIDEDEKGTPYHKITRCRRCGTCLGSCPERIISFKDFHVDMIGSMMKSVEVEEDVIKLIGLVCENDAYPALDAAGIRRQRLNPAIRFIPVRCLGNLNLVWIADALSKGIDGMILLGCKFGENYQCHFVKGSELADYRLGKLHETLNKLQLEAERVKLVQLSISDYDKLPEILDEFVERVNEIGPNPFKEF
ncbi:MAG: FAD-dependent oxidoreductase [Thermodesulfovibrionia bacterium]